MPTLANYTHFDGLHWESGTIRNTLDYLGVIAPHTGQPYSEAMLMGINGGCTVGYFRFAYQGYDPYVRILTRNTFNSAATILARLGVPHDILQTASPGKAVKNLTQTLEQGIPAIVEADMFSLPYNALPHDEGMWVMFPVVVYGYEPDENRVLLADRARVPLTITPGELERARGRVKKDRYRLTAPGKPNPDKLPAAVQQGLWDCLKLYTEKPPKGAAYNFGLKALEHWSALLVNHGKKQSWAQAFPPGRALLSGLTSVFNDITSFGKDGNAERHTFANFLDESALVLDKPTLKQAAALFRASAEAWQALSESVLPDDVPLLRETREMLLKRHTLFLEQGGQALNEIQQIDSRLDSIKAEMDRHFPLSPHEVENLLESIAVEVQQVHAHEKEAVNALQAALST